MSEVATVNTGAVIWPEHEWEEYAEQLRTDALTPAYPELYAIGLTNNEAV